MTEFEKELVRFVSGHLDAGVSAEDYVKAFSQRLLDSIGKQSKPKVCEGLEEEINLWISENENIHHGDKLMVWLLKEVAHHFAKWGAEHLKR